MTTTFNIIGDSAACGVSAHKVLITYDYAVGSIVYNINKARRGILEAVAIKKVRIVTPTNGDVIAILYQDTYNGLWNEYDLCNEQEATDLAIIYLENVKSSILEEMLHCDL